MSRWLVTFCHRAVVCRAPGPGMQSFRFTLLEFIRFLVALACSGLLADIPQIYFLGSPGIEMIILAGQL